MRNISNNKIANLFNLINQAALLKQRSIKVTPFKNINLILNLVLDLGLIYGYKRVDSKEVIILSKPLGKKRIFYLSKYFRYRTFNKVNLSRFFKTHNFETVDLKGVLLTSNGVKVHSLRNSSDFKGGKLLAVVI